MNFIPLEIGRGLYIITRPIYLNYIDKLTLSFTPLCVRDL